jgi:hypothetical protein
MLSMQRSTPTVTDAQIGKAMKILIADPDLRAGARICSKKTFAS